jgi:ParB family chromosome partitioning protein
VGEQPGGPEVALDAITIGVRHRKELGDLEPLMASIAKHGLLQPITLTPQLVLVCGWRRLQAMRRLGWTHTRPWWRPGLSDGATTVLAEHDENFLRQAYSKSEQATLFRELKSVLQQEAVRRKAVHWFGGPATSPGDEPEHEQGGNEPDNYGSADSAAPEELGEPGDTRAQAAQLVTGRKAHQSLQRIGTLMDLAVDPDLPEPIRVLAADAVARIDDGHPVQPEWERVQEALAPPDPASTDTPPAVVPAHSTPPQTLEPAGISRAARRAWVMTWRGTANLLAQHDPTVLGPVLPEADWRALCDLHADLGVFLREAQAARAEAGLATPDGNGPEGVSGPDADAPTTTVDDDQTAAIPAERLAPVVPIGVRS